MKAVKQICDLFYKDGSDIRHPLWPPYTSDFHKFNAFLQEDESNVTSCLVQDSPLWCETTGRTFFYLFISFSSLRLPFSPPFFFVFTESLCSGQNICVHLCVCLPLTWTNFSSFIDVEPPRLSKQTPALNGWLYGLLWSYACHPLSFHPFGYIHRHTCARPLYTKQMCTV